MYGLKYVPPETEFEPFILEFEWLNLNNCIEKLNLQMKQYNFIYTQNEIV